MKRERPARRVGAEPIVERSIGIVVFRPAWPMPCGSCVGRTAEIDEKSNADEMDPPLRGSGRAGRSMYQPPPAIVNNLLKNNIIDQHHSTGLAIAPPTPRAFRRSGAAAPSED